MTKKKNIQKKGNRLLNIYYQNYKIKIYKITQKIRIEKNYKIIQISIIKMKFPINNDILNYK